MERIENIKKIFKDLKQRIAALPRLRNKAMQEELSNVMFIIRKMELAFITHIASDQDEEELTDVIEYVIDLYSTQKPAESQIDAIKARLLHDYTIEVDHKVLIDRIKSRRDA